jgi:hypothetical protein
MPAIRSLRLSLLLVMFGFCFVIGSATARADTTSLQSTGAEQTFTVPYGVLSVHMVAVGGQGGVGHAAGASGGLGAQADADLSVSPGEVLYVEVGGNGGPADRVGCPGGTPGFNGGGVGGMEGAGFCGMSPNDGGGGGGASDVRTVPRAQTGSLSSRLIIAGGGGGGVYQSVGGAAGQAGGPPHPGQPGTSSTGGLGGGGNATDGGPGGGGAGGGDITQAGGGGGGGGGLYGGGGGRNGAQGSYYGSGGGGGSSGFGSAVTNTSVVPSTIGTPSITFTYTATSFHSLTIAKTGAGAGTVTSTDGQINCGPTCAHAYPSGTPVTLTAAPATGSVFAGWSGGGCSGTGTCTVTLSSDQAVTATFSPSSGSGGGGGGGTLPATTSASGSPRVSGNSVTQTIVCTGNSGTCGGSLTATTTEKLRGAHAVGVAARSAKKGRTKSVVVAQTSFSVPVGHTMQITMSLNSAGKRLLTQFKRLPATLTVTINGESGNSATALSNKITFTSTHKKKKGKKK